MALKSRLVEETIITSRKINKISEGAENLWHRLNSKVDDFGHYLADPNVIKGQIYPLRKIMVSSIKKRLQELIDAGEPGKVGLIRLYEVNGETYLELVDFEIHQKWRKDIKRKAEYPKPVTYLNESERIRNGPLRIRTGNHLTKVSPSEDTIPRQEDIILNKEQTIKREEQDKEGHAREGDSKFNPIDIRLCQLLMDLMLVNDPKSSILKRLTTKRQEEWINQCRLLRESDERTKEEIETIIRWCQKDSFWKSNILSMPKLREKFPQLWLKAKKTNFAGIQDWLAERRREREGL